MSPGDKDNLVATVRELLGQVTADKPRAAGDGNSHDVALLVIFRRMTI